MTGGANIIESLYVALGFKVDTDGTKQLKRQVDEAKESILSLGTAFKAFVAGFAIKEIASIGSTFEQNRIQIAGFLSALGLSSDFNAGLRDAEGIIQKITTDAAKLPGEAEEYVEVFKANAAFLKTGLPGANAGKIADFTNKLTAVAKTVASSLDANQIAREAGMLLAAQGRAGGHNVLWTKLMPFLMQLDGQANITAQSFNAMTQPKRVQLLQAAFAKLQPMLDASASSFDAMYGAAVSMVKQLTRKITGGLFEQMKKGLDQLNHLFFDDNGELTAFGRNFVDQAKTVVKWIGQIVSMGGGLLTWLIQSESAMTLLKLAAVAVGVALAGMALESTIGTIAKMVRGVGNLKRALMGGLFVALLLIAEDIYTFIEGGDSLTGKLLNDWPIAFRVVGGAITALGALFVAWRVTAVASFLMTQAAALSAAAATAAAWAAALAPFVLIVAAVAGVIKALDMLDNRFAAFKRGRMAVYDALGIDMKTHESAAFAGVANGPAFQRHSAEVAPEDSFLRKTTPVPAWSPATAWSPAAAGASAGAAPVVNSTTIGEINIHSTDPKEAARETARAITRNGQKGYR
jgi:hypothetical protein